MQVVGWASGYQETLKELGLEDGDIVFPEGHDRGMTLLVNKYIMRMRATLHTWFVNILQVGPPPACLSVASASATCCMRADRVDLSEVYLEHTGASISGAPSRQGCHAAYALAMLHVQPGA